MIDLLTILVLDVAGTIARSKCEIRLDALHYPLFGILQKFRH